MNKHVLMVEDFPVMQRFYKDALERAGYHLTIASDGLEALALVAKTDFDIILLDLLLPKLNGIEFLERYHSRPSTTKIIVLTDFSDAGRMERARELRINDYLIKSEYPPSELVKKLNKLTESDKHASHESTDEESTNREEKTTP